MPHHVPAPLQMPREALLLLEWQRALMLLRYLTAMEEGAAAEAILWRPQKASDITKSLAAPDGILRYHQILRMNPIQNAKAKRYAGLLFNQ
jgi:hypothetical protein